MFNIYCIIWHGGNLTDELRSLLFKTAQEMFNEKNNYKILKTPWCTGEVTTKWETKGVAGISGIIFKAFVDWEDKSTEVEYLCRETDLNPDDGMWVSYGVAPLGTFNLN